MIVDSSCSILVVDSNGVHACVCMHMGVCFSSLGLDGVRLFIVYVFFGIFNLFGLKFSF